MIRQSPVEFSVSAAACIAGAVMLLILPLRWLGAIFFAAAIHECCHLLCLKLFRIPVYRIHVGLHGAAIRTGALSPAQELICSAAGPAGSFLCLAFARRFPLLALCGFLQGIYNLLPVYPLDGGRILYSMLFLFLPSHSEAISRFVSRCIIAVSLPVCVSFYFRTYRPFFLFLAVYFLLGTGLCRKTPCKDDRY